MTATLHPAAVVHGLMRARAPALRALSDTKTPPDARAIVQKIVDEAGEGK